MFVFLILGVAGLAALYVVGSQETRLDIARGLASGGRVRVRFTGYWPGAARTEAERRMEGGLNDRKGRPLHTLEQHLSDPSRHPYVSLAGDDAVWPYGQRVTLPGFPSVVARVVDTGSNFRGAGKAVRVLAHEPIDVCVSGPGSLERYIPRTGEITIVPGDNFEGGRAVAMARATPGSAA